MAYQWYFNKTKIRNQTASSLKLNSVQSSQGGNYFVTVSNSAGSVTSSGGEADSCFCSQNATTTIQWAAHYYFAAARHHRHP